VNSLLYLFWPVKMTSGLSLFSTLLFVGVLFIFLPMTWNFDGKDSLQFYKKLVILGFQSRCLAFMINYLQLLLMPLSVFLPIRR
jgi:hypothetical protein